MTNRSHANASSRSDVFTRPGPAFTSGLRDGALPGNVFEDDAILPEQYFARLRHRADYPGEERLLLAVLEDAVHCYKTNMVARTPRRRRLFDEAEEWLLGADAGASVSFAYVCEVFEFDADYIRGGLRRWRERHIARGAERSAAERAASGRSTAAALARGPVDRHASVAMLDHAVA